MLTQDHLTQRLSRADRAHQRQLGLAFFWRAAKYVAALLLALFILDVMLHLGARARALLALAFVASAGVAGLWALYVARVRRNSLESAARLLESREPFLGSKLINFLQLRRSLDSQPALTRQLGERALSDYSTRLADVDFTRLTRSPAVARDRRRAAWVLGLSAVALAAFFPISKLELLRYADPFGDHPPYSLTRIEIVDPAADGAAVTYNESIIVKVKTSGHQPDELYLSFYDPAKPEAVRTVPMYNKGALGFLQEIEGVKSDLFVYAHTKTQHSISAKRLVLVGLTPRLDKAFVTVSPPAYTGIKPHEVSFGFKDVKALAGSDVRFRVRSNRPLSGGGIELQTENAPPTPVAMQPAGDENEVSGSFRASESGRLRFSLVDVARHVSQQNLSASLTVTHDLPPEVSIENPTGDSFVCEDFKVEARIVATDDYGLKTVRVHRALNEVYSAPKTVAFTEVTPSATVKTEFDIKDLGVKPGDTISFFAEAVDTCPDPHLAKSKTIHLMVISTEEYNNYLRERTDISDIQGKYTELLNDFHDLVDEQKAIGEQIKDLEQKIAQGGDAAKDLPAQLDKLLARQAELNNKLASMAERMDKFVRDKPLYDLESELAQTLRQKADEMRQSTAKSNEALKKAAASLASNPANGGGPSQEKRLEALQALQRQSDEQLAQLDKSQREAKDEIIPPLEDAAQMSDIIKDLNFFKMLYEAQSAAAEQTKPLEQKRALTETDQLALKQLAGTEKQMEQALEKVVADLRQHALAAREKFPKAAESARDLALRIKGADLGGLARGAATTMLAGNGPNSYQAAEKLRLEMEKFFNDVDPQSGAACKEMDKYLRLERQRTAGRTGQQMGQSRKFGFGLGQGQTGSGQQGQGGLDGYSAGTGESFGMLGGETFSGQPQHSGNGNHGEAKAAGPGQKLDLDKSDVLGGVPAANRATGGVQAESPLEGYRDAVDAYFNTITK